MKKLLYACLASGLLASCKTESVVADFNILKNEVAEGESVVITNKTLNAKNYEWSISPGGWNSSSQTPNLIFEEAGTYQLKLIAKNGNRSSEKQVEIKVNPDTVWRLTGNSSKTWYVSSLVYAGTEMLVENCQKDDEFKLVKSASADTFSFTEGVQTCPSGTYIFEIPASGAWRFNQKKKTLEFALTALGSPFNFEFTTTKLTKDIFEGTDAVNEVVMKLRTAK
jgi:PKD repeat protein